VCVKTFIGCKIAHVYWEQPLYWNLYMSISSCRINELLLLLCSVQEYLKDTVDTVINDKKVFVAVQTIIADAPARSFIKQCTNHNSYNGCEKCVVRGDWSGRVIFQNSNSLIRTDESFFLQEDPNHHLGISPFV
jgi:hypothetical protein